MRVVRWLDDAIADVREIYLYIAAGDPPAAARVVARIQKAADSLSTLAGRGRPGRWPGTRELIVTGTPYLLPYRVKDGVVEIMRVFHVARDWPELPEDE